MCTATLSVDKFSFLSTYVGRYSDTRNEGLNYNHIVFLLFDVLVSLYRDISQTGVPIRMNFGVIVGIHIDLPNYILLS